MPIAIGKLASRLPSRPSMSSWSRSSAQAFGEYGDQLVAEIEKRKRLQRKSIAEFSSTP